LDTGTVVVLRESGQAVADLVSTGIDSEDSVIVGVAGGAESGKERALSAGRIAGAAGKRAIGVDDLVESSSADALTVDEGPVVLREAGSAGG
jgi:hypothetical protein